MKKTMCCCMITFVIGLLIGVLLYKNKMVPEFYQDTRRKKFNKNVVAKVKFENPEVVNGKVEYYHFTYDDFMNTGFFTKKGVERTKDTDKYFTKVTKTKDDKHIMQFGDQDRDLIITDARIFPKKLNGLKAIVKPREIILLPPSHEHAPEEDVEYRI